MAQWAGQYSGGTHRSKVKELTQTLDSKIKKVRSGAESADVKGLKSIAKSLLQAELRLIGSKISEQKDEVIRGERSEINPRLLEDHGKLETEGIDGILKRHNAIDLYSSGDT